MSDLLTTPLHAWHEEAGAKFAEFGGWSMPLEYAGAGILSEHAAVRSGVGIFDVSHLGTVWLRGPGAKDHANGILTNDLGRIAPGQAQYTLLCNESGGVIDDLIVYLFSDEELLLVPNAANAAAVIGALTAELPDAVDLTDEHRDRAIIAVQGTQSDEVLREAGLPAGHDYMEFAEAELATDAGAVPVTVCRTGYTGERGYEVVAPADGAKAVWQRLIEAGKPYGMQPAGLGARDTLRTELGYPLHGQDLSPEITALEAKLGWAIGWDKSSFAGHEALRQQRADKPTRLLRGLVANGRGIPRPGMTVSNEAGEPIGTITSGTFSPTLKKGIGLALITVGNPDGSQVNVEVRNRQESFTLTKPPFVAARVREG
ncbi:glycine cleavage system aminomethyltransferase GcvT [Parenemella sanctibonifatiensis]|uniref:Aminomethyltransferase n=1 Tax=Parenemella sanctibonifatiensis TaxID=2016505 RepID=A0A255EDK8_9ACTN|nr:glycine cleavage system aminomethyltransferase GcvT [Parenemella sanctibonifatiensis]OYN89619.1 glycine cleavage system protein T [Parenemella sanctibonifatiensis]